MESQLSKVIESATNKKSAKTKAKKQREALKKKQDDEKAKLLFSEDDKIVLEVLNLTIEGIVMFN